MPVVAWVPIGQLPRDVGYVRIDSLKYNEWQVLAYAATRDKTLFVIECEMYEQWMASQPPTVDGLHTEYDERYQPHIDSGETTTSVVTTDASSEDSSGEESSDEISSEQSTGDVLDYLERTFVSIIRVLTTEGNDQDDDET
ncbi:hypothetical protein PHMEG_0007343 [Phytophthora megakarya]|uniref:Uncharacterized protein n=1 Tax=Phytophthora megakarya TaxID=4795 RepID=A0A225WN28_9STRA|nr:hypothetical protein PHMEG_0007343 [Phytophthora megakarya]